MALGSQLPIRLDDETDRRLSAVAARAGTSKSAIIRLLATTFVEQVVSADGSVKLPPNWADLLPKADARAVRLNEGPAKESKHPVIDLKSQSVVYAKKRASTKPKSES